MSVSPRLDSLMCHATWYIRNQAAATVLCTGKLARFLACFIKCVEIAKSAKLRFPARTGIYLSPWVKGLEHETNLSSQSSAKIKNQWSYNFTIPYVSVPKAQALICIIIIIIGNTALFEP